MKLLIALLLLTGCGGSIFDDSSTTIDEGTEIEDVSPGDALDAEGLQKVAKECCLEVREDLECECFRHFGLTFGDFSNLSECEDDFLECVL